MSTAPIIADRLAAMRFAARGQTAIYPELADGTAQTILEQAQSVADDLLAPLDSIGDRHGVVWSQDGVATPPGWAEAYRTWADGGWNGLGAAEANGGSGLPHLLAAACFETWSGANMAFALAPLLTAGAVEALSQHGSEALKAAFLPKLVSGTWTGTMNLTEPQAGSDLAALTTRAERAGDGTYRIKGQKIFITYGEHAMTDNIVHLVLARLPDAPAGTRGISLFLVPKTLVEADGSLGRRNDVRCVGVERKLGIHGAPTCTMAFGENGGAVGYLVGEEHRGLACMFTMMNNARLTVGLEGVAAADKATRKAVAYARERRQGRAGRDSPTMDPIIAHPDVARMLMTMRTLTAGARALCYRTAAALDAAKRAVTVEERDEAAARAALLTPIAKAFSTDIGNEVASLGVQVHGGSGFVEDTGAAQIMRDVRIAAIYEGTNGIQAIDLVTRKLPLRGGETVRAEIADMREIISALEGRNGIGWGSSALALRDAIDALERATTALASSQKSPAAVLSVATPYLRLFALARCGTALAAIAMADGVEPKNAVGECRFFAEQIAPEVIGLAAIIERGGDALAENAEAWRAALEAGA